MGPKGEEIYAFPRIKTRHTHGTGCTLSTAIACGLAQGLSLPLAVGRAREYVQHAIETAPGLGKGQGPLNHLKRLQKRVVIPGVSGSVSREREGRGPRCQTLHGVDTWVPFPSHC